MLLLSGPCVRRGPYLFGP